MQCEVGNVEFLLLFVYMGSLFYVTVLLPATTLLHMWVHYVKMINKRKKWQPVVVR
jgi:hypothetical protein